MDGRQPLKLDPRCTPTPQFLRFSPFRFNNSFLGSSASELVFYFLQLLFHCFTRSLSLNLGQLF